MRKMVDHFNAEYVSDIFGCEDKSHKPYFKPEIKNIINEKTNNIFCFIRKALKNE